MRRWLWVVSLIVALLGSSALALGFSVRGATRYDIGSNKFGLEGELEYADKLNDNLTWGVRASVRKIPLLDGDLTLLVPNLFAEFRQTVEGDDKRVVSWYGRAELALGLSPQIFPRTVLSIGADSRFPLSESLDGFLQLSGYWDFIVTNRSRLGLKGRAGAIMVPFVPYLAFDLNYDLYPGQFNPNIFAGTLLYLSQQFFLGLEGGYDTNAYLRLFFEFSER